VSTFLVKHKEAVVRAINGKNKKKTVKEEEKWMSRIK